MVRFSDMLGGDGEPKDPRAATVSRPATADPIPEAEPEAEPVPEVAEDEATETPQAVLERLTQYATSTRTTEPAPEAPEVPPAADPDPDPPAAAEPGATDLAPVGDDLLPQGKGAGRKPSRRDKRRP